MSKDKKKQDELATAVQIGTTTEDGSANVVGIGNLRVMITNDDGSWFAQALEIDYAAQGDTEEDVKQRFEKGLEATIDEHLQIHGTIEKLLQPAPQEVWVEMFKTAEKGKLFSQVSVHIHEALQYENIEYFQEAA